MKWNDFIRRIVTSALVICICLLMSGGIGCEAQDTKTSNQPQALAQPAPQPGSNLPPLQLDENAVLHHLNQIVSWYRQMTTGIRDIGLPSDAIYQDNAKARGAEAVQLAFQSAKAQSALISLQNNGTPNQGSPENTQQKKLEQAKQKTSAQIDQLQSEIEPLNAKIQKTPGSKRTAP